jgi:hypothetical protein
VRPLGGRRQLPDVLGMARIGLPSSRRSILSLLAATAAVAAIAPASAFAAPPTTCTKVAAPTGSDSAAGTEAAPFKTVQKLVSSLSAGQTGCLRAGTYGGADLTMRQPDTGLQSYPGERATLTTFLEVSSTAPRSRVSGLKIDTTGHSNSTGTKLQADDVVFSDNEVTKGGQGICILAGTYNAAQRIVIERNVIYNCGAAVKPDGTKNKFDHQIYLSGTRNAIVRWNVLRDNPGGWGVHMYPNADGTLVEHNIIDGNQGGVIFAGEGGGASDSNTVRNNVITGSNPRWNIEGSWSGGTPGTGNTATHNCLYSNGPSQPSGIATQSGFSASSNTVLSSLPFANRAAGDLRFKSDSPCANLVGDVLGAIAGRASAPVEPAPAPPAAPADPGVTIIIRADRRKVSLPRSVRVKGKIKARESVNRVKLQVKTRKGNWRTIARRSVHNSRFQAKLRGTKLRRLRVARLRAVVPGKAKSHVVRVKVTRRAHR